MSTPPSLTTDDSVVRTTLRTLDDRIADMRSSLADIVAIKGEVHDHFKAACSTRYQENIDDWTNRYNQLKAAYESFQSSFTSGHQQINAAHDDANGVGGNWSVHSSHVKGVLNPS